MKSEVNCIVNQTNLIDKKSEVLFQGTAELVDNQLTYYEQNIPHAKTKIEVSENFIQIIRIGEASTKVKLFKNKNGCAIVSSELGELEFETTLKYCEILRNSWLFEYQIMSENEIILHTSIECKFSEN